MINVRMSEDLQLLRQFINFFFFCNYLLTCFYEESCYVNTFTGQQIHLLTATTNYHNYNSYNATTEEVPLLASW